VITVGIGELEVSADPAAVLVTHALGSCIAVVGWDPRRRIGGLLHFQLPASSLAPARARAAPGTFADTGIPLLFARMRALGAREPEIVVKAAGGGRFHPERKLDVGERNQAEMRRIFRDANVRVSAEDVGGSRSRTVRLFVESGLVTVQSGSEVTPL
jgi:chemotaxis protein CheD